MKEFYAELQPEYQKAMAEMNQFISQTVPRLNQSLQEKGAPTLVISK